MLFVPEPIPTFPIMVELVKARAMHDSTGRWLLMRRISSVGIRTGQGLGSGFWYTIYQGRETWLAHSEIKKSRGRMANGAEQLRETHWQC